MSFADFYRAVHRDPERAPYPWQERFAERCATEGLPALVGVPTGCGKTTVVDALVWALAAQADRPYAERTVGVRIVWAIDRRILVDEVHEHATALAQRLLAARDDGHDPLHETAVRLARLSGDVPLEAVRWRGGLPRDRSMPLPAQPQVITSTVAQIGSRLLFRGYGVGRGSLSVAAGLAACDTTICLDEAHLAEPFRQTVDAIRTHRAETEQGLKLPGLSLITLTATPSQRTADAILLEENDRAVPGLRRRLHAAKWVQLEATPANERERVKLIADRAALYSRDGASTVACVLNTVKRARDVFDLLARELQDDAVDVALLVGPQRPADREVLFDVHGDLLFGRAASERPLICVATQTFEVGLNADMTAMITDSASASALVQRLGRLNRRGRTTGLATIIRDESSWLYEADEPAAWKWLEGSRNDDGVVDVSVAALDADPSRPLPSNVRAAPTLTSVALELLVATSPQPGSWQEPSVEGFLRGAEDRAATDVTVCWRCDLLATIDDPAAEGYREMLLELVPPEAREQLTLSVNGARALLAALYQPAGPTGKAAMLALSDADVEGEAEPARVPDGLSSDLAVPFLVIRRGEVLHGTASGAGNGRVRASALQPGDLIVLPAHSGGVDKYGLAPGARPKGTPNHRWNDKVADVAGDRKRSSAGGVALSVPVPVRISRAALGEEHAAEWRQIRGRCSAFTDAEPVGGRARAVQDLIDDLSRLLPEHEALSMLSRPRLNELEEPVRVLLRAIGPVGQDDVPVLDEEETEALEGGDGPYQAAGDGALAGADTLERTWVLVPVAIKERERQRRDSANPPPTLKNHAIAVRSQVDELTASAGLPDPIRLTLALAAAAHDHGKADPRTQAFFHGGIRPLGAEPIAKSIFGTDDPRTERMARAIAGLPTALRHEIASVAILAKWLTNGAGPEDGIDRDLVLHLVGTHHGQGRPIPRIPTGGDDALAFHVDAADISGTAFGDGQDGWADGEWLQRFWRVIDRYGPWGTSYLEALLVLADRTVSARGG